MRARPYLDVPAHCTCPTCSLPGATPSCQGTCSEGSEGGGARRLTLQPIRPKLRLIWHMSGKARRVRLAALLLGMIFLVAQCHFCSVCSVAGSAVATQSPTVAIIRATQRLEIVSLVLAVASVFPCAISPRASPAL